MIRVLLVLAGMFYGSFSMAIEEPEYEVVAKFEDFELRRYAPYVVAETVISGDFKEAGNKAFPILAGYIFGKNVKQTKIDMTAPVNQSPVEPESEKIDMTAPVSQAPQPGTSGGHVVSFTMPSKYTLETLPRPEDSRVRLRQVQSKLMAALRYSGTWSEKRYRAKQQLLLDALTREGLVRVGDPVFARYNAPYALWFLRRNEVLVEVQDRD